MILLATSDFETGKFKIADAGSNTSKAAVTTAITRFEKTYILKLFGKVLGEAIITYIQASNPTPDANFDKVIASFFEQNDNFICGNKVYESRGLKEFLQAAIYYEYLLDTATTNTQAGQGEINAEVLTKTINTQIRQAEKIFNEYLETIEAIQWWCSDNSTDYPDFAGETFIVRQSAIF